MDYQPSEITFAILDERSNIVDLPDFEDQEYPLPAWYREVRHRPLSDLGIEDIGKACRQNVHVDYVVPLAINVLNDNPIAGEMYDGELLVALADIPSQFWIDRMEMSRKVRVIIERAKPELDDDIRKEIERLTLKLDATCD